MKLLSAIGNIDVPCLSVSWGKGFELECGKLYNPPIVAACLLN